MKMDGPERYQSEQAVKPAAHEDVTTQQTMVADILIRARTLARSGDLPQADSLLKTLSDTDSSRIEVIDLLAKVYAQQGKIDQARALWLQALQREPSNIHFLSALTLCAYHKKSKLEHFVLRYLWLLLAVVLWLLIAMAAILSTTL